MRNLAIEQAGKAFFANTKTLQKLLTLTDVADVTPVYKDKRIADLVKKRVPFYEELVKEPIAIPDYHYLVNATPGTVLGKWTNEADSGNETAQEGTYQDQVFSTKLVVYKGSVGILGQKATKDIVDIMAKEQEIAMTALVRQIENTIINGDPSDNSGDGGPGDADSFSGFDDLTFGASQSSNKAGADITIEDMDAAVDYLVDEEGMDERQMIHVTNSSTKTQLSSEYYDLYRLPLEKVDINAGFRVESYRNSPILVSSYMPTTTDQKVLYTIDKETWKMPVFYDISQIELGRTGLSDDFLMFAQLALAYPKNDAGTIFRAFKIYGID